MDPLIEQIGDAFMKVHQELTSLEDTDITRIKVKLYRGFQVKNEKYKQLVDLFLNDIPRDEGAIMCKDTEIKEQEYEDLALLMFDLYNQEDKWLQFNQADYTPEVLQWAKQVKRTLFLILQHHLVVLEIMRDNKMPMINYIQKVLLPNIILYDRIYTAKYLGFNRILKEILTEMIELSNDGCITAFLVFAHFCPDLVFSEVIPFINRESKLYQETNFDALQKHPVFGSLYRIYQVFIESIGE